MQPRSNPPRASFLLVEECFAREDAGFIAALKKFSVPQVLAAFAERWLKDARPWARAQIFAYLDEPLDSPGHHPLVKRLFKGAEARRDHELMGAFLVAFDVAIRRKRSQTHRYEPATRDFARIEYLATPRDVLPRGDLPPYAPRRGRLFSHRTRHYLRRRAWRYFRWMGYRQPDEYPRHVASALARYTDQQLAAGENILDSWSLLNICFYGSDALEFTEKHHRLREGRSLAELHAAPRFPEVWTSEPSARLLLSLVTSARAHLVRMWAMELYRQVTKSREITLSADDFLALLNHRDERVQEFGAQLFTSQPGLDRLPVTTWLQLLRTENLTVLATLVAVFSRHVTPERLTLGQTLDLACAKPVSLARIGLTMLQARTLSAAEIPTLTRLGEAQCSATAAELTRLALAHLGTSERYKAEWVTPFFDSRIREVRDAAWSWLVSPSAGYNDPVLWSRLSETPFDDLRLTFIDHLAVRERSQNLNTDQLAPIWCAVLLGVHRGGRQKLKAVRQIANAVIDKPSDAARLLPVLVVAVRSVRGPEMRAGLAAVLSVVDRCPGLTSTVHTLLPELQFSTSEVTA
jgi:hypothetical protein